MRGALSETVEFLTSELGPSVGSWSWGRLHAVTYSDILGDVSVLGRLFNQNPYPVGGDDHTLWATGASLHDLDCSHIIGLSFRLIADLGDLRNSLGMLAPGQSGHPGSRHYDDHVCDWFAARYHPMLFDRTDVDSNSRSCLRRQPQPA